MEFCPKCGTRLVAADKAMGGKATLLKCQNCGYQKAVENKPVSIRVVEQRPEDHAVIVMDDEKQADLRTAPTMRVGCPKCGNMEAYVWLVQTRGADESSTQFLRCTKCGQTWRKYS